MSDHESNQDTLRRRSRAGRALRQVHDAAGLARDVASAVTGLAGAAAQGAGAVAGSTARSAAREAGAAALKIARSYLGKSSLLLPLPELLLNNQINQRLAGQPGIDHLSVSCSHDRLDIKIDGHVQRIVYTVDVSLAVISCDISADGMYLHLQQIGEDLDAQLRQAGFAVNWVARQVGRQAFRLANRLPVLSPLQQVMRDVPGITRTGPKRWRIDLEAIGLIDVLSNRTWILERLLALNDQLLPGLPILRQSGNLLAELAEQLDVRDIRVRAGRLDVSVGIGSD